MAASKSRFKVTQDSDCWCYHGVGVLFRTWKILVVDDEPDVLAVTKMALRRVSVYGLKLELVGCSSKEEAVRYFQGAD